MRIRLSSSYAKPIEHSPKTHFGGSTRWFRVLIVCAAALSLQCRANKGKEPDGLRLRPPTDAPQDDNSKPPSATTPSGPPLALLKGNSIAGVVQDGEWLSEHELTKEMRQTLFTPGTSYQSTNWIRSITGDILGVKWDCDAYIVDTKEEVPFEAFVIGGSWNLHPRPITPAEESDSLLKRLESAISRENPVLSGFYTEDIRQVVSADLDGDGRAEIIAALMTPYLGAQYAEGHPTLLSDYSGILVLPGTGSPALWSGLVEINEGDVFEFDYFTIDGIADLNGDGRMSLIIEQAAFSGGTGIMVFDYSETKLEEVGGAGWGERDCDEFPRGQRPSDQ